MNMNKYFSDRIVGNHSHRQDSPLRVRIPNYEETTEGDSLVKMYEACRYFDWRVKDEKPRWDSDVHIRNSNKAKRRP